MSKIRAALALLLLSTSPLHAATIDQAGADKLKASLQKQLDFQKKLNEAFSIDHSLKVIYEGDLTVTPDAEFYAVTLPKISIKGKNEENKEETLDLGVMTANAIPTENDGEWKMMSALPQTLKFGEGEENVEINIGGQTIAGVYSDMYGFTKVNFTLQDVTLKSKGVDSGLKLGGLKYIVNLDQNEDKTFSGPLQLSVDNFDFADPEKKDHVKLDNIQLKGNTIKLVVPTVDEMSQKLDKFTKEFEESSKIEAPTEQDFQQLFTMLSEIYTLNFEGFDFAYSLKNLKVTPGEGSTELPASITLTDGVFGLKAYDVKSDSGSLALQFGYSGLSVDAPDSPDSEITPTDMNIDLKADKVPYNALVALGTNATSMISASPEMAQMAAMATVFKLPAVLAQAKSEITISNTYAKNPNYDATLDGKFIADMTAIMSVTGKLMGVFTGLDRLIEMVAASPNSQDLIEPLNALKAAGKTTGNGAYTYDIEITADGRILINGNDAGAGGMPADPAPAVEPAQ